MKVVLVFNKFTGAFIGSTYGSAEMNVTAETCDQTNFKYKEVDINPELETWEGDYETGKIVKHADQKVIITEEELNIDCQDKIFRKYRYYRQLNILYGVIDELIKMVGIDDEKLAPYNEMREYLSKIRENNDRYKEAYKNTPGYEYWDKAKEREELNKQLEGGLHEVIGRDKTTNGVI